MFASASDPLLEDLHIDLFSIIHMFVSYGLDPCSSIIIQQEETKVMILDANLLRDIDSSLSPSKSDTFNQGWSISLIIYWRMKYRLLLQFSIVQSFSYHKMSIPFHYHLFFHYHCPHHCSHHCFHHIHQTERRRGEGCLNDLFPVIIVTV